MKKSKHFAKLPALILSVLILLSFSACSPKKSEGFSSDSLCVVYQGVTYKVGDKAQSILKVLGAPANTISQTSCHYGENGDEHTYESWILGKT